MRLHGADIAIAGFVFAVAIFTAVMTWKAADYLANVVMELVK